MSAVIRSDRISSAEAQEIWTCFTQNLPELNSNEEIVRRIQEVANKVTLGKNGSIVCHFRNEEKIPRDFCVRIITNEMSFRSWDGSDVDDIHDAVYVSYTIAEDYTPVLKNKRLGLKREIYLKDDKRIVKCSRGPFYAELELRNHHVSEEGCRQFNDLTKTTYLQRSIEEILSKRVNLLFLEQLSLKEAKNKQISFVAAVLTVAVVVGRNIFLALKEARAGV